MNILIAGQADAQGGLGGMLGMLPLMVIMFLIMYFIIIRPQKKQQKQFEDMIANLKKGDRILTKGGIYCIIIDFNSFYCIFIFIQQSVTRYNTNFYFSYINYLYYCQA